MKEIEAYIDQYGYDLHCQLLRTILFTDQHLSELWKSRVHNHFLVINDMYQKSPTDARNSLYKAYIRVNTLSQLPIALTAAKDSFKEDYRYALRIKEPFRDLKFDFHTGIPNDTLYTDISNQISSVDLLMYRNIYTRDNFNSTLNPLLSRYSALYKSSFRV